MVKVTWLAHRDYIDKVLYTIGTLRTIQFIPAKASPDEEEDGGQIQPAREEAVSSWESLRSRVATIASTLQISSDSANESGYTTAIRSEKLGEYLQKADGELSTVETRVNEVQQQVSTFQRGVREDRPRRKLRSKNLEIRMFEIAQQEAPRILAFSEALEAERQVSDLKQKMNRTGDTYLFQGWVPKNRLEETISAVKKASEGYADTVKIEPAPNRPKGSKEGETSDLPPTLLRYERFTQVFEIFASLGRAFGLPNYYEVDPTIFFLISFPLIFGMMYGDIGHGLLLLGGAVALYHLKSRVRVRPGSIPSYALLGSPLLILCAVSSIVFGFLYGELFGSLAWFKMLTGLSGPLWFSPADAMNRLLRYAIYVGIVQISFGLVLGTLNKYLQGNVKGAVSGPLVWLWLYLSGAYLVVRYGFRVFTVAFDPATFGLFIAPPLVAMFILRVIFDGPLGVNETVESLLVSFSHSVSYVRILALKLVSSIFSSLLLPASLVGFAPFIIGTVALVLFFETLLVFLHTLRLHWIEWFSKFYQGTGKPFSPFSIPSKHVRIV